MTGALCSEGLAAAARVRRDELLALADTIAGEGGIVVVEPPAAGSTMLELATRVGSFCFTEVVVTTARVQTRHGSGWGCVMGWDAAGALAAALCDARRGDHVEGLVHLALADEELARTHRQRAVAATKV